MAKKLFQLQDVIEVKKDGQHVKNGEIGTIVYIYTGGDYEVKFEGKTVLLSSNEIKIKKNGTTNKSK